MDVTDVKQILFTNGPRCARFEMILMQIGKYDRVHGASLLAISTVDTLEEINVIPGGTPGAILTLFGLDCDRQSRANRLA
jgi:hypothetical protein